MVPDRHDEPASSPDPGKDGWWWCQHGGQRTQFVVVRLGPGRESGTADLQQRLTRPSRPLPPWVLLSGVLWVPPQRPPPLHHPNPPNNPLHSPPRPHTPQTPPSQG